MAAKCTDLGIFVLGKDYIVVVETDDLIRQLLERWLGEAGYVVTAEPAVNLGQNHGARRAPVLVIAEIAPRQ
jgi:DNA-binding response OmpR family regulator